MAPALLRLRSDEQLIRLFRDGHDEAFRVIHDRYHQRLFAYTRQMLPRRQDAEDALQDVFVRVYTSLRASDYGISNLRPWLYRAAHNRCIDELRRPSPPSTEVMTEIRSLAHDPIVQVVERESFARVVEDIRRLPAQQRSALLLRELGGAHYADIAIALGVTVPAVKSLLVRARITLAGSLEARDTSCSTIREELTLALDQSARPNATARAHLRDCAGCREFRSGVRGASRELAGLVPALGPLAVLAKALGLGGAGGGASAGGATAVGGSGALAPAGMLSAGHVATLIAAAVVTAGGAVTIQSTIGTPSQPSQAAAPAVISNAPTSAWGPAPRAAARTPSAALRPRSTVPPPANRSTVSSTSGPPVSRASSSPISKPSTTGTGAVSKPKAASSKRNTAASGALGRTSITGTNEVGAAQSPPTIQGGTGAIASTPSSSSGGSTTPSSNTSQSGTTTGSSQTPDSSSSTDSAQTTTSPSSPSSAS